MDLATLISVGEKKIPSEINFKYLFITERGQKDTSNKKEDCDNSTVISDTTVAGVRREEKLQNSEMNEESLDFGEEEERHEEERKEEEEEMRPEEHRVREGETLVSIAATYDVTPSQFAQHNKLGKSLLVSTGITLSWDSTLGWVDLIPTVPVWYILCCKFQNWVLHIGRYRRCRSGVIFEVQFQKCLNFGHVCPCSKHANT